MWSKFYVSSLSNCRILSRSRFLNLKPKPASYASSKGIFRSELVLVIDDRSSIPPRSGSTSKEVTTDLSQIQDRAPSMKGSLQNDYPSEEHDCFCITLTDYAKFVKG